MTTRVGRRTGSASSVLVALVLLLGVVAGPAEGQEGPEPATGPVVVLRPGAAEVTEVSEGQVAALRRAGVPVVQRGDAVAPAIAQSVPLVGAPAVWATGQRGAGQVIVVIDTGVAAGFGGALVGQACFAADATGEIGYCGPTASTPSAFDGLCFDLGVCGAGDVRDAAAGRPCPTARAECAHGSAVAAVAARRTAPLGVAPDASVYAIQVFDPEGQSADFADLALALDHVDRLAEAGLPIAAVNLSVATLDTFPGSCDAGLGGAGWAFKAMFDRLAQRGILAAVATGNEGRSRATGFPACVSSALSVGASTLADGMAGFGNRGPGVDLVAPGTRSSSVPLTVPSGTAYSEWTGTSFAAPHVAGALALLHPTFPKATAEQLEGVLRSTAVPVHDPATGLGYRRLRLDVPSEVLVAGTLFPATAALGGGSRVAVGDFDGDGHEDVASHAPGPAPDLIAYGRDDWQVDVVAHEVGRGYELVAGNFLGAADGPDELLWYAPGRGADHLWTGQPNRAVASTPLPINGTYVPYVGNFDGDGWDDIFWLGPGGGADYVWYGGPTGVTTATATSVGPTRAAVGDFDGDGRDDLFLHGPGARTDGVWTSTTQRGAFTRRGLTLAGDHQLIAANITGDGADDLVLYEPGSGGDQIWTGGGTVGATGATAGFTTRSLAVTSSYVVRSGDVDADGYDELLWYAEGSGADHLWLGGPGSLPTSVRVGGVTLAYTPVFADLDADGGDDLVWLSPSPTSSAIWWSHRP